MFSFFLIVIFLGLGFLLSDKIAFFKKYRIPASLTVALAILILCQIFPSLQKQNFYQDWRKFPADFVALLFSALFIRSMTGHRRISPTHEVLAQTILVWITVLGQIAIGTILTLFLFQPVFSLSLSFAGMLEAGFSGGHGTAIAIRGILAENGMPDGGDYALFSATVGIALGIFGGLWLVQRQTGSHTLPEPEYSKISLHPLPICFALTAVFSGYIGGSLLKDGVQQWGLPDFPLFAYAIIAAILIKFLLKMVNLSSYLNQEILAFFTNLFMDLLILASVATLNLTVVSAALLPLFMLFTAGFGWNLFSHFYLSKKLLPAEYGRELAMLNFGMYNATAAIGLLLLRILDPQLKSPAVHIYARSALLVSPFLGGGIISLSYPYLITHYNPYWILLMILMAMALLFIWGLHLASNNYKE